MVGPLASLLGDSPGIVAIRETVARLLANTAEGPRLPPILIQGETGTGKGLLARAIHQGGPRAAGPLIELNCAAIPEPLLEAELFGFERGAFTDARQAKPGLFQAAHRGTLFLDEVGLLPEGVQGKLLKAVEDGLIRRLGGIRPEPIDVAILAASSEDLTDAVRRHRFREDLYHRLAVVTLRLPPLRERGADVIRLADHFLARAAADYGLAPRTLSRDARDALLGYPWPGNVRELANVMERVALLAETSVVTAAACELPALAPTTRSPDPDDPATPARALVSGVTSQRTPESSLRCTVGSVERDHVADALRETGGNIARAAVRLGLPRGTLRSRLKRLGLRPEPAGSSPPSLGSPPAGLTTVAPDRPPSDPSPTATPRPVAGHPPVAEPSPPTPRVGGRRASAAAGLHWVRRRLAWLRATVLLSETQTDSTEAGRALELLVEKVEGFGGAIKDLGPLEVVAAFGVEPVEDAPRRAAHAALAIQKAVERARGPGATISLRIGVHAAPCLIRDAPGGAVIDVDGRRRAHAVLEAMMAEADPGQILVSGATAPLLARRFHLRVLGAAGRGRAQSESAVGFASTTDSGSADPRAPTAPVPSWRCLTGVGESEFAVEGHSVPFVGRRAELGLLQSRLALAIQGQGQVVGIGGEAGIGKSRLVFEFHQDCAGVTTLRGTGVSYGASIPYLPILALLREHCGVSGVEPPEAIEASVSARLEDLGLSAAAQSHLLGLFGIASDVAPPAPLPPEVVRAETFDAIRQMILAESRRRPVVVTIEDLHWIDATSEACLASLAEVLAGARVLLIATYRSGYRPPWLDTSYATQLALQPLSRDESVQVVRAVWRDESVPRAFTDRILARAGGNPFFLEELSRGALADEDGTVPDTVQDVLHTRIDRLSGEARRILQVAAVVGREVPRPLLEALDEGAAATEVVPELKRLEFLRERSEVEGPVYVFKHALTQEVAYDALSPERRRALHLAIGRALEAGGVNRRGGSDEVLAYHFVRAEEWRTALGYLVRAGARAATALSTREALGLYDQAMVVVDRIGPEASRATRIQIHQARAQLHGGLSDFRLAHAEAARAAALARASGDRGREGEALLEMAWASMWAHDLPQALVDARQALDVAESAGVAKVAAGGHSVVGTVHQLTGQLEQGRAEIARALAVERTSDTAPYQAYALVIAGEIRSWAGEYADALPFLDEGVRLARAHSVLLPLLEGVWFTGVNLTGQGDYDGALAHLEEARALAEKIGDEVLGHRILNSLGWLYAECGDLEQALLWNRRGAEAARTRGDPETISNAELNLADLFVATGELAQARELLDGVRQRVEDRATSEWMQWRYTTHLHASLGELALAWGALEQARDHADRTLELATRHGSRKYLVRGWRLVGEIALAHHRAEAAEAPLGQALTLAETIGNPTQLWKTHVACGRLYRAMQRPEASRGAIEAARAITERIRTSLASAGVGATFERSPLMRPVYAADE